MHSCPPVFVVVLPEKPGLTLWPWAESIASPAAQDAAIPIVRKHRIASSSRPPARGTRPLQLGQGLSTRVRQKGLLRTLLLIRDRCPPPARPRSTGHQSPPGPHRRLLRPGLPDGLPRTGWGRIGLHRPSLTPGNPPRHRNQPR